MRRKCKAVAYNLLGAAPFLVVQRLFAAGTLYLSIAYTLQYRCAPY